MAIKSFGQSPILQTFDALPTWVGPAGMQIAINGVGYISDGTKWTGPTTLPAEEYLPLWWSSGAAASTTSNSGTYLAQGQTVEVASNNPALVLHNLSNKWSATQKFALEATLWCGSPGTCTAQLYDYTAGAVVAGTNISTTSTTATIMRSGGVTLTPGHSYGVKHWSNSSSVTVYATAVSIVALLL